MYLKGIRNIVDLGAGESGSGSALLAKIKGYDVFVSDFGKIADTYKKELKEAGIIYEENNHTEEKILAAELIIKSPGIPDKAPIIQKILAKGINMISDIEFGSYFSKQNSL